MAFSDYKSIAQVQAEFRIRYQEQRFVTATDYQPSPSFLQEFEFNQQTIDAFSSEAARCETVIFPILREVYKRYYDKVSLWIQTPISYDAKLSGTPDYLISKRSPLGKTLLEYPLLVAVEAKRNDFQQGWGQALAELVAIAKLNADAHPVYGIVTDGKLWEFGQFSSDSLTKDPHSYTVSNLIELLGAVCFVFEQAVLQTVP